MYDIQFSHNCFKYIIIIYEIKTDSLSMKRNYRLFRDKNCIEEVTASLLRINGILNMIKIYNIKY